MVKRRVTNALIKRMKDITNKLYMFSVIEVMKPQNIGDDLVRCGAYLKGYDTITSMYINDLIELENISLKKEEVSELYLSKIITLSTSNLENILLLHERHKFMRAQKTIEMIISELARRGLINDSSQSETNI